MATRSVIGIIGAAISGPVFALQILSHPILRQRFRPILFDQLSPPTGTHQSTGKPVIHTAGAGVGIFPNGLFPLYELGLRERLDAISCEMEALSIWRGDLKGSHKFLNSAVNTGWAADLGSCPRTVERTRLREMLVTRFKELGGETVWNKKVKTIVALESGRTKVAFMDEDTREVDLLVGADGAWSAVRKYILQRRDPNTAEKLWVPPSVGCAGIYGISSNPGVPPNSDTARLGEAKETYLVLLDQGNIGALVLGDGKVAWTLHYPEKSAPERSTPIELRAGEGADQYKAKLVPGVYEPNSTVEILHRHENIWHPVLGSFKALFEASERIIRSPLRQAVWEEDEIQCGNVAVIGDASRVVPPYMGQGSSLGIEDATVLANSILNSLPPEDEPGNLSAALKDYAHTRVSRSKKVANVASWQGALSMGERWWWRLIRDWGSRLPVGGDPKKDPSLGQKQQDLPWLFGERIQIKLHKASNG